MNVLKAFFRLRFWEGMFNNIVASFLLVGMMLLVVSNVTARYIFDIPVHGTLEISQFIMVGIVYFTLAHTQAVKAHIKVELLLGVLSHKTRLIFELVTYILGLLIFILITWQSVLSFLDSYRFLEETEGYIPFPIYPAKATIPVGCFLLCLRFVIDIIGILRQLTKKESP